MAAKKASKNGGDKPRISGKSNIHIKKSSVKKTVKKLAPSLKKQQTKKVMIKKNIPKDILIEPKNIESKKEKKSIKQISPINTTDTRQELKDLFTELFQLDNTDLDFGIYRILNIKAEEVREFIKNDLDARVEQVKSKILDRQSGDIKAELEAAKTELTKGFQVDFQKEGDLDVKANQYNQLPLFQEPYNKFKTAKEQTRQPSCFGGYRKIHL